MRALINLFEDCPVETSEELLVAREVKALRITIIVRMAAVTGLPAMEPFISKSTLETVLSAILLATFGTPTPSPDDAVNAVRAAIEMCKALTEINDERRANREAPMRHGIGIHKGLVIVGNAGSAERLEYTVIGDAVNTASRLESKTKDVEAEILLSDTVMMEVADAFQTTALGSIQLAGKTKPITVFTLEATAGVSSH
ncbi:MAG: hypothetical protein CMN78_00970 [Spirochaetales bacterium]|nr:hypothetical protein [Spirochaetales bacterium]